MTIIIMLYMLCGGGVAIGICDAYRDQEGARLFISKVLIATFWPLFFMWVLTYRLAVGQNEPQRTGANAVQANEPSINKIIQ